MSAEEIRSIGCGPIGAVISAVIASLFFHWQVKRWSRWMPTKVGEKGKKHLLKEYRSTVRTAKTISLIGLFIGWLFYITHLINDHDWRGLGIGAGLMAFLPIAYIVAANIMHGTEKVKEALVAFVIDQKTPPKALFVFIGLCFVLGVVSAISLLLRG